MRHAHRPKEFMFLFLTRGSLVRVANVVRFPAGENLCDVMQKGKKTHAEIHARQYLIQNKTSTGTRRLKVGVCSGI